MTRNTIYHKQPDFFFEFENISKFPQILNLSIEKWLEMCEEGRPVEFSKFGATSPSMAKAAFEKLDVEKQMRFNKAYEEGVIEMPIMMKLDEELVLIGGNARLTGMVMHDRDPMVWLITAQKDLLSS